VRNSSLTRTNRLLPSTIQEHSSLALRLSRISFLEEMILVLVAQERSLRTVTAKESFKEPQITQIPQII
jgi:hypothetical protein